MNDERMYQLDNRMWGSSGSGGLIKEYKLIGNIGIREVKNK